MYTSQFLDTEKLNMALRARKVSGAFEKQAPDPQINTLFQTCLIVRSLVRTDVKGPIDDDKKGASSKKHTQFKTRVQNPYPISDQNGRNRYPFYDQNGY